ncbi:disulfide bond formation protein DsbB [Orbus mooreae]|uniref:disulfide bond formation protein DsbB n=1 Tax=Orbus mooreae TaxID=3074107 RepID=UPI00370D7C22
MLNLLNQYSSSRISWTLLLLCTLAFEGTALFFQHGLNLAPCTLCIYQRVTLLGIVFACLVAMIGPKYIIFRLLAIFIWLYCAVEGFNLATFQARLQFAPSLTDTCSINVQFPSWLPLNSWFPNVFNATGSCSEKLWSFLTIEMSQWMIIIFSCYFIVGCIILLAQFFSPAKQQHKWSN